MLVQLLKRRSNGGILVSNCLIFVLFGKLRYRIFAKFCRGSAGIIFWINWRLLTALVPLVRWGSQRHVLRAEPRSWLHRDPFGSPAHAWFVFPVLLTDLSLLNVQTWRFQWRVLEILLKFILIRHQIRILSHLMILKESAGIRSSLPTSALILQQAFITVSVSLSLRPVYRLGNRRCRLLEDLGKRVGWSLLLVSDSFLIFKLLILFL